ncbi:WD repeat-containing protein 74, partial [Dinochytrium kinnereticum]
MAALKSGVVRVLDVETGEEVRLIHVFDIEAGKPNQESFVGLYEDQGTVITCTSKGHIAYHSPSTSNPDESPASPLPTFSSALKVDNLCRMRVFSGSPCIFATGGDEKELTLWDASECKDGDASAIPKEIWKAKNVKNNYLDLRVPVHILDIQFLEPETTKPTKIAISTRFKQVRVYDLTGDSRRPIISVEFGDHPLKHLSLVPGRS